LTIMSDESQLKVVKDYIAKYNLEEELSNAVNQAIKLDSDDPYRVISDYLRAKAKEPEDDEEPEDEDDVIAEGDEPVVRSTGRRNQVAAKKFEVPDNWTAPKYEKPEGTKAWLKSVMETNKLMKNLAPSDREMLMDALFEVNFEAGKEIIKQGDEGDKFYILEEGTSDISITGKGSVMKAQKGIAFGELALLHGAPRAATVTAETSVKAWALDETSFKMILMGKAQSDGAKYLDFLQKVPIISHLEEADKKEMAANLKEEEIPDGRNIILEGDEGEKFYIIRSGEVKVTKSGVAEEVSKRLTEGDFFGELALLNSDKRAATVTATAPTTVLTLTRAQFTRLLGKLEPPSYK